MTWILAIVGVFVVSTLMILAFMVGAAERKPRGQTTPSGDCMVPLIKSASDTDQLSAPLT